MKKIILLFLFVAPLYLLSGTLVRAATPLQVYFFWGDGCPHCAKESAFLNILKIKYPNLIINDFEVTKNQDNALLFIKTLKALDIKRDGVPLLVIGDKHIIGYADGLTSNEIEKIVNACLTNTCPDKVAKIINPEYVEAPNDASKPDSTSEQEKIMAFPILGEMNINKLSLPIFTIVMGALDGFNPCAMWTLLFLISLLIGINNRKRRWILGTAFIVASAAVYFIFMSAWLNLVLFIGFVIWIRLVIGVLALLSGGYNLKEFALNKNNVCKITNNSKRQRIFEKIKNAIEQKSFWLSLGGIIVLAFMVNLIELICSAGLPAIYTQVLVLNDLTAWQYYLYILLYIFFFMLDDLFVFFVAMVTLEMTGITSKYTKLSRLIGGLLLLIIGLLMLFKPEWLMFG